METLKATSDYARQLFAETIAWAESYGQNQVDHFVRTSTEEFAARALTAAVAMVEDDLRAKHASCLQEGILDRHEDRDVFLSAVSMGDSAALSVRYPDGDNLLFIWNDEGKSTSVSVLPWRDRVPEELLARLQGEVEKGTAYAGVAELAKRVAMYSGYMDRSEDLLFAGVPLSIADIAKLTGLHGLDKVVQVAGVGRVESRRFTAGITNYEAYAFHDRALSSAQRAFSTFGTVEKELPASAVPHAEAMLAGRLPEFYASTCALAIEYQTKKNLAKLGEMISASSELGLSAETVLAYHDTDVRVYAEIHGDMEMFAHTNIDLNEGCVFATVLTKRGGEYATVDVYLANRWSAGFENYFGGNPTDRMTAETATEYVNYVGRDRGLIDEDRLAEALAEGMLPDTGKAFSFDLRSGELEITPLASATGYLNYLPLMIEYDHKAIMDAARGEFEEWGSEFQVRLRADGPRAKVEHIEPASFVRPGTSTPKNGP